MSYDVSLMADTGNQPVEAWSINHTSNTSGVWRAAGCDIASFHGQEAWKLGASAAQAWARMQADPEAFRRYERGGGTWGTVETTMDFLLAIAQAARDYPKTEVQVWA